ncbi:flavin reductase family protein [Lewinella cohaerens]|uniref:flavin reductase family protein n=1 Tax=Lewinella cohaerens TaxID=70995 RepID=UPI00035F2BF8|nr:flavin reductase family protein [Lewinella cohaerens]
MNKGITTIIPGEVSTGRLHGFLVSSVAPRPIAFASTIDKAGNVNLSPFSFFNVFGANPPIMIFSPARRVRNNTTKHTLENIKEVAEVVINIVNYPIVEQMSLSSTEYDKGVNEFMKAGLTEVASEKVGPPRVGEAPVAMECVVEQVIETGKEGGAGNLVIARVVAMHIRNEYLNEQGTLDTHKLDLVARMGESWYCRASGDALFEIPKPLQTLGIGVDQLPESVRNSSILTGNNLGRLGNIEQLPDDATVKAFVNTDPEMQKLLVAKAGSPTDLEEALHRYAQTLLAADKVEEALMVLLWKEV